MSTTEHSLDTLSSFLDTALARYWGEPATQERARSQPEEHREHVLSAEYPHPTIQRPDPTVLASWDEAEQAFEAGQVLEGIVTGWNRGGLLVRWNGLQAFVPISQLKEVPVFESDEPRDEALARWVGEELKLRVIELDRARNRVVLSERATLWGP